MNAQLEELYNKYPWKTFSKFFPIAKRHGFDDPKLVKKFIAEQVIHDEKVKDVDSKYLPIFSTIPHAYQFDTFFPAKGQKPFLIFININTRKAYGYEMNSKNSANVMNAMEKFINNTHPKILESDQDSAYLSNNMLTYLKQHDVIYSTVSDNDHHVLGIINRFIRTLRDLHENGNKSKNWNSLIDVYNNSPHRSLPNQRSPNEMDEKSEQKYIDVKREETNKILNDRVVYPKGLKVRIEGGINGSNMFNKKRSILSKQAYVIDGWNGSQYYIKAKDGSVDKVPYFRIVPVKKRNNAVLNGGAGNAKMSIANTIKNSKRHEIEKIISYDKANDRYKVQYTNGDKDNIPSRNLREGKPLFLSDMEREFWKNKETKMPNKIIRWL
jgi:hypothetical protein